MGSGLNAAGGALLEDEAGVAMEDAALQRVIAQLDAVTVELRATRGIHAVVSPMCPPKDTA